MTVEVSGPVFDEGGNLLTETGYTIVAVDQIIGQNFGARVERGVSGVTDGSGVLTADLEPGRYILFIRPTRSAATTQTFERQARMTVLTGEATMTLQAALDTDVGEVDASTLQLAQDAAAAAATAANALFATRTLYSGDGTTTSFTLPYEPGGENGIQIFIDGVHQDINSYSVSGTTLLMSEAPPAGTDNMEVLVSIPSESVPVPQVAITKEFETLALLKANTDTYTTVTTGDYWRVVDGGYVYKVAASGATDEDVTTVGGVKLYVQKANNVWPMLAFDPNADGTTDDSANIDEVNNAGEVVDLGGKSYEYSGVFTPVATFINGSIIDDNRTRDYTINTPETAVSVVQQNLPAIKYFSTTQWVIQGMPDKWVMSGMRLLGQWQKASGVTKLTGRSSTNTKTVHVTNDLAFLNSQQSNCWYGIFAVANDEDDTVTYKVSPFMRSLNAPTGSVITLGKGGWNQTSSTITAETFDIDTDAMAGRECVVIGENGAWSGRVTTITANTTTTVTVADIGSITTLDYFLPIPEGDHYVYLGAVYIEGSQPKNLAPQGNGRVLSSMTSIGDVRTTGAYDPQEEIEVCGMVPPTATAAIVNINAAINSSTAGGDVAQYIYHDSGGHEIFWEYDFNPGIVNYPLYYSNHDLAFSSARQSWYYFTAGSHDTTLTARQWTVRGWVEA